MKSKKQTPMVYKRDKFKVEISGDPKDTKWPVWFDLLSSRLLWVTMIIILLIITPKVSLVPVLWEWLKKQLLFLTLFVVAAPWLLMLLSG